MEEKEERKKKTKKKTEKKQKQDERDSQPENRNAQQLGLFMDDSMLHLLTCAHKYGNAKDAHAATQRGRRRGLHLTEGVLTAHLFRLYFSSPSVSPNFVTCAGP